MPIRQPRYSKEEACRRGEEIFDRDVRTKVEADNQGKYVAIDIDSGAWELDDDEVAAGDRLLARFADAQIWMTRVGYGYIRRFGAGRGRRTA